MIIRDDVNHSPVSFDFFLSPLRQIFAPVPTWYEGLPNIHNLAVMGFENSINTA